MNKSKKVSFEDSMKKLEKILEDVENSNLTLDQLVDRFEQSTELSSICIKKLKDAQLKVNKLVKTRGGFNLKELK